MSSEQLWQEAAAILNYKHVVPGHSTIETIHRLWAKHPAVDGNFTPPVLVEDSVHITEDWWDLEKLGALLHERQKTNKAPASLAGAIIVLRWEDTDYLIDGRRRINHWQRTGEIGPHRVLLLHAHKKSN